jgi:hypothetical protein
MAERKYQDYEIDDLEVVEEIEIQSSQEPAKETKKYKDYDESDTSVMNLILDDVFDAIKDKDWQVIARTNDKIVISEVLADPISDISEIQLISIRSDFFFEIIDRQSRFTSASLQKKISKVKNSANYYWFAEEVDVEILKMKGIK